MSYDGTPRPEGSWSQGHLHGFARQFGLDINNGEFLFFSMQVGSVDREFQYDLNVFRVQVYLQDWLDSRPIRPVEKGWQTCGSSSWWASSLS